MGTHKETCAVSGINIGDGDIVALFLLKNNKDNKYALSTLYSNIFFTPLIPPIYGSYNDYGSINVSEDDITLNIISEYFNVSKKSFLKAVSSNYSPIYTTGYFYKNHRLNDWNSRDEIFSFLEKSTEFTKNTLLKESFSTEIIININSKKQSKEILIIEGVCKDTYSIKCFGKTYILNRFYNIEGLFKSVYKYFGYYLNYSKDVQGFISFCDNSNGMFVHKEIVNDVINFGLNKDIDFISVDRKSISFNGLEDIGFKYNGESSDKFGLPVALFSFGGLDFIYNLSGGMKQLTHITEDGKKINFSNYSDMYSFLSLSTEGNKFLTQDPIKYDLSVIKYILNSDNPSFYNSSDFNSNELIYNLFYFDSGCLNLNIDFFINVFSDSLISGSKCDNTIIDFVLFNLGFNELGKTYSPQVTVHDASNRDMLLETINSTSHSIKSDKLMLSQDLKHFKKTDTFELHIDNISELSLIDFSKTELSKILIYNDNGYIEESEIVSIYKKIFEQRQLLEDTLVSIKIELS